jgi:hypothetical protein
VFVVSVHVAGTSTEVRWSEPEAVLGSGAAAGIRVEGAGWAETEAILRHAGAEVVLARPDGSPALHLRVGDAVRLGEAEVRLIGLLPLGSTSGGAGRPAFGGYEDEPAGRPRFALASEPPPRPRREVALSLPKERFGERMPPPDAAAAAPPSAAPGPTGPAAAATAPPDGAARPKRAWRTGSFEEELVGALRRAPWFVLSGAIHAVVLFAMLHLLPGPPPEERFGGVEDARIAAQEFADAGPLEPSLPGDPEPEAAPVESPLEPPEPLLPEETDEPPEPSRAPAPRMPDPADEGDPPALIGTSPSLVKVDVRRTGKPPTFSAATKDLDAVSDDARRAEEQNRKAAGALKDLIRRAGGSLGRLKGLGREDLLVVTGSFDHMDLVLKELELPHATRGPGEVEGAYDFDRHKVVFWNCGQPIPAHARAGVTSRIREFVRHGGYLFTSDWMVQHVLVPAFRDYVGTGGSEKTLPELVVDARPADRADAHPLLEGVFLPGVQAKWWLESTSFDVVPKRADVETLIVSPTLKEAPWNRSPALAVTFPYGRGRVLHTMGHYYQQKGNVSGTIAAQRLALNFVRQRLDRDAPSAAAGAGDR